MQPGLVDYGQDDREFESRQGLGNFLSPPRSDRLWGPHSSIFHGYQDLFPLGREADHSSPSSAEVRKRGAMYPLHNTLFPLGREADHSSPSSAEVKKAWSYVPTPQYVFMAWWSVKSTGTTSPLPLLKYLEWADILISWQWRFTSRSSGCNVVTTHNKWN
jgi:hypothetical protein